jgi:hypothetical protein
MFLTKYLSKNLKKLYFMNISFAKEYIIKNYLL